MKGWLTDRLAWMDGEIANAYGAAPPVFNQDGGEVGSGFTLTMTAQAMGGGGQNRVVLIDAGARWQYKDDGSDQGTESYSVSSLIGAAL